MLANAGATVAAIRPRRGRPSTGCPASAIAALLAGGAGVRSPSCGAHRASLEEAYMELTRDAVEFAAHEGVDR